ncbi:MAG: RNA methyltransferase [Bacteroidales bacterium]|nr:RNA methyltransferase [Bacteroidales bacterium]
MRKLPIDEIPRLSIEEFELTKKIPLIVVLDNIRSHHNIGAIFRTCDAFACEAVYLCGITGKPPHRDIHKTALGATETVKWKYFNNTIEAVLELKSENFKIVPLEIAEGSIQINGFSVAQGEKIALVLGNEVKGVEQKIIDIADACIEIPQYGTKHSLNVSVSGGIAIWDLCMKMR